MHAYIFFIRKLSVSLILKWDQVNVRSSAQRFLSADLMPSHDRHRSCSSLNISLVGSQEEFQWNEEPKTAISRAVPTPGGCGNSLVCMWINTCLQRHAAAQVWMFEESLFPCAWISSLGGCSDLLFQSYCQSSLNQKITFQRYLYVWAQRVKCGFHWLSLSLSTVAMETIPTHRLFAESVKAGCSRTAWSC